jgi:hypothetical protein
MCISYYIQYIIARKPFSSHHPAAAPNVWQTPALPFLLASTKSRHHGLSSYKDTKTKCSHLKKLTFKGTLRQVLIKVYKQEIHSQSCWYFRPSFVNYCPFNLLSGSPTPPPPLSLCQSTVCGCGGWVMFRVLLETIFCISFTFCIWPDSEPTKLLGHPKQNSRCVTGKPTCSFATERVSLDYV